MSNKLPVGSAELLPEPGRKKEASTWEVMTLFGDQKVEKRLLFVYKDGAGTQALWLWLPPNSPLQKVLQGLPNPSDSGSVPRTHPSFDSWFFRFSCWNPTPGLPSPVSSPKVG